MRKLTKHCIIRLLPWILWDASVSICAVPDPTAMIRSWSIGIEGQRQSDLGNGYFLNPIIAGDRPAPSVLKDGDDYFMVHASLNYYPGLLVWHSRDLVNWQPVAPTLFDNVGTVCSPNLIKHHDRYYIYFSAELDDCSIVHVISSDRISGPWSHPIDLNIPHRDPAHAVSEDGGRFLFFSGGYLVQLDDNGLSIVSRPRSISHALPLECRDRHLIRPSIWSFDGTYHMTLTEVDRSVPESSCIVVLRSRALDGPWEYSLRNPIVRTAPRDAWQDKAHATVVEGVSGGLFLVYQGRESGLFSLGFQTIMQPMEVTNGWLNPRLSGHDVGRAIRNINTGASPHGQALSDDFLTDKIGVQWAFHNGGREDRKRYRHENGTLVIQARGILPEESSPLAFIAGDPSYIVEVDIQFGTGTSGGLILFGDGKVYSGLGISGDNLIAYNMGMQTVAGELVAPGFIRLRLVNDRNVVSLHYRPVGGPWHEAEGMINVSNAHRDAPGRQTPGLRPAIYSTGKWEARFRNVTYEALTKP